MTITYNNLKDIVDTGFLDQLGGADSIAIFGMPKSGKSILAKEIQKKLNHFTILDSDDFKQNGWKQGMYDMYDHLIKEPKKYIVCGVQVGRLLRHGLRTHTFQPDVIIEVFCDYKTISYCYIKDGERSKLYNSKIRNYIRFLNAIYQRYLDLESLEVKKVKKIKVNTSFT
jgi:hypothetical protein